jgi:uncharacterized protein involved in exopolysaccharide biosynthesis
MNFILSSPSADDLIRLLRAWRFWLSSGVVGALIGLMIYFVAPPPYRSYATVNVDFNLEQAWPAETDRQQFYYLERETRKLEEVAWSDAVLEAVASRVKGVTVPQLREELLQLGQPGEAGWHFYADAAQPGVAADLASTWAMVFTEQARARITAEKGISSYIQLNLTQSAQLPVERNIPYSIYMLAGSLVTSVLCALVLLLTPPKGIQDRSKRSGKRTRLAGK